MFEQYKDYLENQWNRKDALDILSEKDCIHYLVNFNESSTDKFTAEKERRIIVSYALSNVNNKYEAF